MKKKFVVIETINNEITCPVFFDTLEETEKAVKEEYEAYCKLPTDKLSVENFYSLKHMMPCLLVFFVSVSRPGKKMSLKVYYLDI